MDSAPLPSFVLDSWTLHAKHKCPSCGRAGVYANGRSRICKYGVHQWAAAKEN